MPGLRWTDEEYAAYLARQGAQEPPRATQPLRQSKETGQAVHSKKDASVALETAWRDKPRYKSKTEARFVQEIAEPRQRSGEITLYVYEPLTLKLAPAVRYTPDFLCLVVGEPLPVLVEVKMWMREDAWQKLKIAAAMWPIFRFELWTYKDKQWTCKQIPNH